MATTTDSELMSQVRGGRTGALGTLFERHHARLYRFCLRMTGNRQVAEDLVQDIFMRMLKYKRTFRDGMAFAPWMFRIARNACADHLRRAAWEAVPAADADWPAAATAAAGAPADVPAADEHAGADERTELLRRALLALPVERREVLLLSRYEFKSYAEIARVLGCSAEAVKVRAHRAMKQLRQVYLELSREAST